MCINENEKYWKTICNMCNNNSNNNNNNNEIMKIYEK